MVPIEVVSPKLERIVSRDQEIEELGRGFSVAEGPLWWREEGYLLFNEVRGNRRRKWSPTDGVTLLQEPSNNANGLTRDSNGRLLLCEGGANRVTRVEPDGEITVGPTTTRENG
jgi:gluconolactonase